MSGQLWDSMGYHTEEQRGFQQPLVGITEGQEIATAHPTLAAWAVGPSSRLFLTFLKAKPNISAVTLLYFFKDCPPDVPVDSKWLE